MNISAVSGMIPGWTELQGAAKNMVSRCTSTSPASSTAQPAGTASISPLAQFLSKLQQIQQQSPSQYKSVASNIASRLQKAAQKVQSSGDTAQAGQLGQLATLFQNSAQSGQVPTAQALEQAFLGGAQSPLANLLASVTGA
jgi:hypothetical protein